MTSLFDKLLGRKRMNEKLPCKDGCMDKMPDPAQDEDVKQAQRDAYDRLCRLHELDNDLQLDQFERRQFQRRQDTLRHHYDGNKH